MIEHSTAYSSIERSFAPGSFVSPMADSMRPTVR
jgi:hypothetical protein